MPKMGNVCVDFAFVEPAPIFFTLGNVLNDAIIIVLYALSCSVKDVA